MSINVDRLVEFVSNGGELVAVHDSLFPRIGLSGFEQFHGLLGVNFALDAMSFMQETPGSFRTTWNLVIGDPENPMRRFPVHPRPTSPPHPVLEGVQPFDVGDEFWAINTAADVAVLAEAVVGDRLDVVARLRQPMPVVGVRKNGKGRVGFCLLGHFNQTYDNPNIRIILRNLVLWVAGVTHQEKYLYDLFIAYPESMLDVGENLATRATAAGLRPYLAKRQLTSGAVWDDEIRTAFLSAREMCVVFGPESKTSEWVTTEWGAAWFTGKRIAPILVDTIVNDLPERLRRHQVVEYAQAESYLQQVAQRAKDERLT